MRHDLRYALRAMRQNPGFALTAIASIALGIGANGAIFSLADGLLLRPLPVPGATRVVSLRSRNPSGTFADVSYRDYLDFRDRNRSFESLVAYKLVPAGFASDAHAQPEIQAGFLASANFFAALHVEPALGRGFRPEEDLAPGRDAVVVLGHSFWQNRCAADPSVVGRRLRLNGIDFTVVGVAPESFTGLDQYFRPSFFVPAAMAPKLFPQQPDLLTDRANRAFTVKGRLKPGVSRAAANADVAALAAAFERSEPATDRNFGAAVRTEMQVRTDLSQGDAALVTLLFAIVTVVLLIACANVANLLLGRGRARAREIAVRLAIGASRGRLIRQLLTESLLIALAGGALGLLVAEFFVEYAATIQIPSDVPIQLSFRLDARVFAFMLLASLASALLFGLAPALQSTRSNLVPALKSGDLDQRRGRLLGRNVLVAAQVAGSLVLLVTATQLFRGFQYVLAHSPGFRTDHLLMMSFDPALARYTPAQTTQFYKGLIDRARGVPGVQSAALTYSVPFGANLNIETVVPEGFQLPAGKPSVDVPCGIVDEHFFETFGVPLLRGRAFLATDRAGAPRVAVVNAAFADQYLGAHPVGKRIRLEGAAGSWAEVVGIAATGKYFSVIEPPIPFVYLPLAQKPQSRMILLAQTSGDPAALAAPLREAARSLDAGVPVFGVRTMGDFFEQRSVKTLHFVTGIVATVGVLGLALALVGLYAVVAYQVTRRTREIGIRVALGANRPEVMRMVLRHASLLGAAGAALGILICLAIGRALTAALRVPSFDPLTFALAPLALLVTTLLAAALPARRAARIDPMQALRQD